MLNMKFKLQTNKRNEVSDNISCSIFFISQDAKDIIALFMTQLEK